MRPFLLIKEGEPFSPWKVYLSVKRAYATGIFRNITVEKRRGKKGIILEFKAFPKKVLKNIVVVNPVKYHYPSFLYIRKGDYLESEDIIREIKRQKKYLRENGYFLAKLTYEVKDSSLFLYFNPGPRFKIKSISVNLKPVRKFYGLSCGEFYSRKKLQQALKRAMESLKKRGFLRARLDRQEKVHRDGVEINITISKGKKFSIKIRGAPVPARVLLPYWSKNYSKEWSLYEGKTALKEYLLRKGMYVKNISAEVNEYPDLVEVVYRLEGLGKLEGRKILVEGNQHFSKEEILKTLRGKPGLFQGINLERLRESLVDLREKYLREGFRDVSINWEVHREGVVIKINEGKRFLIGKLTFRGNERISLKEISGVCGLKQGMPYYNLFVYQAAQRIRNLYLEKGFRKFEVSYKTVFRGNRADVQFSIREGVRPSLSLFVILGSATARGKRVIKKLLPFKEGQPVNGLLEDEGRLKLEVMGLFTRLEIRENIWDSRHMDLIVRAEQLPSYLYSFGVGWESRGGPRLSLELSARNLLVAPMFINASMLLGGSQRVVGLTSETPRLVSDWDFRSTAVYERGNMVSYSYETSSLFLSLFREREEGWDQVSLRISRVELFDLLVPPSEVDREFFPSYITSLTYSYALDRRDDPINPSRGWFFSASLEKYFSVLGTSVDGAKTYFHLQIFKPLRGNLFAAGAKLGLAKGNLPISERFFAGGPMSFRGESLDRLSPTSPATGMPLGGMGLAIVNLEYRIKLLSDFSLIFFYDGGEVTRFMHELSLKSWENAVGVGLRYITPFGPIRLEAGYNPRPSYGGRIKFFISLGEIL